MSTTKTQEKQTTTQVLDEVTPKAVATQPKRPVAPYEETGFEGMQATDFMIPFLNLLQKNSPEVEEENPKHIPGAKAGMFKNSVTSELFDGKIGIVVEPVHVVHSYLEWIPRDDGGGLQGVYDHEAPEVLAAKAAAGGKTFGKLKTPPSMGPEHENNDLVETYNVFAIQILPDGTRKKVVLGFSSSQIAEFRRWMTNASEQTKEAPDGTKRPRALWSHKYRLTTVFNQNKKGSWYKYHSAFDGVNAEAARYTETDPAMADAKAFRALLVAGTAQADFATASQETVGATESEFDM